MIRSAGFCVLGFSDAERVRSRPDDYSQEGFVVGLALRQALDGKKSYLSCSTGAADASVAPAEVHSIRRLRLPVLESTA